MKQALFSIRFYSRMLGFFILISLIVGEFQPAQAQWRIVAPNLTQVMQQGNGIPYGSGSMCFRNGIVWLFTNSVFMSTDSGNTWTTNKFSLPLQSTYSFDIDCLSPADMLLNFLPYGTLLTSDSGSTWKDLPAEEGNSASFLNNANGVALTGGDTRKPGLVTFDGGTTWKPMPAQDAGYCVRYKNGTIYEFGGSDNGANLITSSDSGATWRQGKASIDWDCFSFAVDSCGPNRIYLSHEDYYWPTNNQSQIILTTDRGDTWQPMVSNTEPFFSGSIAEGPTAVYCPSISNGIFRSTDKGSTWSSIDGPSCPPDTRLIAALSDNILLVVDAEGNVWRTDNSGGDSIIASVNSTFSLSTNLLFAKDTVYCDSLTRSILFITTGCPHPSVSSFSVVGADSESFLASNLSSDSIQVTLYGTKQGNQNAKLVLNLNSGSSDTVSLAGYVNYQPNNLSFNFNPKNITTAAGDTLEIPIYLSGNADLGSTSITLPFGIDTNVLHPIGFVPSIPGITVGTLVYSNGTETVPLQSSDLTLNGETLIGYLRCIVYLADTLATSVTLQNPSLTSTTAPCVALSISTDSVNILINGCGDLTLLQFMKTGQIPLGIQSIVPNPSTDAVQINFINPTSSAISYQVIDALGQTRLNGVTASDALSLDVSSLTQGVYFFRATNGTGFSVSSKLVIVR